MIRRLLDGLHRLDRGERGPAWFRRTMVRQFVGLAGDAEPVGIELCDDPAVADRIRNVVWRRRFWVAPPIVVGADDFLTPRQARDLVGLRTGWGVTQMVARGQLQQCFRASDGAPGVTVSSAHEERAWRDTSTRWQRVCRRVGGLIHWI